MEVRNVTQTSKTLPFDGLTFIQIAAGATDMYVIK